MFAYTEPAAQRDDLLAADWGVARLVDTGRDHGEVALRHLVILGEGLDLLPAGGDDMVAASVDQELLANTLLEAVVGLDRRGSALHVAPLPLAQAVWRVEMGKAQLLGDALARPAGVPVVRGDHVVCLVPGRNGGLEGGHEGFDVIVHVFLADETGPPERDSPHA